MDTINLSNGQLQAYKDVRDYGLDRLKDLIGWGSVSYLSDLHDYLYNQDYFIIYTNEAKQWLIENYGVFEAMETIKEYEQENFGEVNTDLSSAEAVANMLAYILGQELLCECKSYLKGEEELDDKTIQAIIDEFEKVV